MIDCTSCGAANPPDSQFCEDCGAQLNPGGAPDSSGNRLDPLEPGAKVAERFEIEALLERGPIRRYRTKEGMLLFESIRSGDTSVLKVQRELLTGLPEGGVFLPAEFAAVDNYDMAWGPLPGTERLEDKVLRDGALPAQEVETLANQLLDTLSKVHKERIVSRAVQPSRIWVGGERPVLDCFERSIHLDHTRAEEEVASVSPGFSAPEMYGLGALDHRADLFSLAATLYFALTGTRPNLESRESFFSVPHPEVQGADSLVYVVMKSLSKSPDDRFADAEAMKKALKEPAPANEPSPAPAPRPAPVPAAGGGSSQPQSQPRVAGGATATAVRPATSGFRVAMKSDIGCVRKINQDACLEIRFKFYEKSQLQEAHLVVVIDGMGGEAEGDKAASIALRTVGQEVVDVSLALKDGRGTTPLMPADPDGLCRMLLQRALEAANRNIFGYASLDEERRGMGCTITACLLRENKAYFGHVGDTRGYHSRGSQLDQVTTDHSLVGRLVALGSLTPEEARVSPQRSIIYRAMGTSPDIEVDIYERQIEPGDRIVLCSDGIWEYYQTEEFEKIVTQAPDPEALCDQLVRICLQRGADDNATVAVVQV